MLDKLRERVNDLIDSTTNKDLLNRYTLIKQILSYDECFTNMDANTAISIIKDLNFSDDIANDIYLGLLKEGYGWNIQVS